MTLPSPPHAEPSPTVASTPSPTAVSQEPAAIAAVSQTYVLQPASQHGSGGVIQHVASHPHDVGVAGGAIDLAKGRPDGDLGVGPSLRTRDDLAASNNVPRAQRREAVELLVVG